MSIPLHLVAALVLLLSGCTPAPSPATRSSVEPATTTGRDATRTASATVGPTGEVVPLLDTCSGPSDPFSIREVGHNGDLLRVTVTHGGGCAEHTYQACWNGALAKSMPSQASVELRHDGHADACEAELTETLEIDVSSVLEAAGGTVVIRVGEESIRVDGP